MEKYSEQLNHSYQLFKDWCKKKIDDRFGDNLRIIFKDGEYVTQEKTSILFIPFWQEINWTETIDAAKYALYDTELNKVYDTGFSIGKYKVVRTAEYFFIIKKDHWYSSWQPVERWNFNILTKIFEENKHKYHFGIISADSKGKRAEYEASDAPEVKITKLWKLHGGTPSNSYVVSSYYSWLVKKQIAAHTIFEITKRYAELLDEMTIELSIKVDLNRTL